MSRVKRVHDELHIEVETDEFCSYCGTSLPAQILRNLGVRNAGPGSPLSGFQPEWCCPEQDTVQRLQSEPLFPAPVPKAWLASMTGTVLDHVAEDEFGISRNPEETDVQLRARLGERRLGDDDRCEFCGGPLVETSIENTREGQFNESGYCCPAQETVQRLDDTPDFRRHLARASGHLLVKLAWVLCHLDRDDDETDEELRQRVLAHLSGEGRL